MSKTKSSKKVIESFIIILLINYNVLVIFEVSSSF